jgi:hypothetical protein
MSTTPIEQPQQLQPNNDASRKVDQVDRRRAGPRDVHGNGFHAAQPARAGPKTQARPAAMTANARLDGHAVQLCLESWQKGWDSGFRGEVGNCPKDAKPHSFAAGYIQGTAARKAEAKQERRQKTDGGEDSRRDG